MRGSGSVVERLDVERDMWELGLTTVVSRSPEIVKAIESGENRNGSTLGEVRAFSAQQAVVAPVSIPKLALPQAEFEALQKWEGQVLSMNATSFVAKLIDLTQTGVEEEVVLELSEVTLDDHPLVVPGAVFYWSVGYRTERSGERSRSSVIWFRRLPAWTHNDIALGRERAAVLKTKIGF